jgi:hypothetical protein
MHGKGLGGVEVQQEGARHGGDPNKSTSSPSRSPGTACHKSDAQATYEVGFGRSIYGWKDNFIKLAMALVSP